jgi:hypothetical protein
VCYGNPAKSLEIARSRMPPEQWQRFEREFDDFCVVQGLEYNGLVLDWARWAFFQGRQHWLNAMALVLPVTGSGTTDLQGNLGVMVEISTKDVDPEISKMVDKEFWNLIDGNHESATFTKEQWNSLKTADQRVADAKYTRLALAMMDDEQAEQSLERWMGRGE